MRVLTGNLLLNCGRRLRFVSYDVMEMEGGRLRWEGLKFDCSSPTAKFIWDRDQCRDIVVLYPVDGRNVSSKCSERRQERGHLGDTRGKWESVGGR